MSKKRKTKRKKINKYFTLIVGILVALLFLYNWFGENNQSAESTSAVLNSSAVMETGRQESTENQGQSGENSGEESRSTEDSGEENQSAGTKNAEETDSESRSTENSGEETKDGELNRQVDPVALAVFPKLDLSSLPEYGETPYTEVNDNVPFFTEEDLTTVSFEYYSPLDELGRCQVCVANIGTDIMPTEERGSIGSVKPSGWHTVKYAGIVDGNYLYNRCHLIGFQLAGENANKQNLITGTRYLNVQGMLPFENLVAEYVEDTDCHVLYRVSPIFEGENLVATGVLMEAYSVEDDGEAVCFNVFCYNVQPGVEIDYATGESWLEESK